jgi:hypothetical protein
LELRVLDLSGKGLVNRAIWVAVFFIVSVIVVAVGASMPVNRAEAETSYSELQNELKYVVNVPFIFGNNFMHTLIMFTPFVDPLYGMFVFFNTGVVLAILAIGTNVNAGLLFMFLFLFPHTWLEFAAYSLALSQSLFLTMAIFKKQFKKELTRTCIIISICALILLLAAVWEVALSAVA